MNEFENEYAPISQSAKKYVEMIKNEKKDRFYLLNPEEKEVLRVLIQNHLNTISEVSLHKDFRVTGYIDYLSELEHELIP